ncbi:hypothetical protein A2617_04310 [Candidatus Daviesbacteria bacterium RIFOXYD1_FULL_41_10]|uniref:D-isomer specific 2-hydroxyacid dehydrogenase NAD-binding domain-containing protein n=2 Tax=Candidatus Daviesiibacteriota TaxID=1752718 RepID=A0A1F5N0H8_9BACT|nr:MAG: hypothetical protein A2617_04310 [Candidatus Daviesbacteria bacterium RIFOXYD1_FULL_41_10]
MKFKKALFIGINETQLDQKHWDKIDEFTEQKVLLPKDSPQIQKELSSTDCLLCGFGVTITKQDLAQAPNLKYIGVLSTAYGKINTPSAKEKGITVCNIPGYSTEAVAEFTFAALLENIRKIEEGKVRGRQTNYSEAGLSQTELKDKVFGVLGLGSIGARVAEIALGFGADTKYWSRTRKPEYEKRGVKYQDVDSLIAEADFLSINLAQTTETEKVLNTKRIQSLKMGGGNYQHCTYGTCGY